MLKKITGTIASRLFIAVMNLLLTVQAGHALGASGLGIISLVVLGITLVMLPANLIGGGALVYLVPRRPLAELLRPAYAWALISCMLAYVALLAFPVVPAGFELHVCALAFIQALYTIHFGVLAGQQRIRAHNIVSSVHAAVLLLAFTWLLHTSAHADAMDYVHASYVAFGLTAVLSAAAIRWKSGPPMSERHDSLRTLLRQGLYVQGANGAQLLNYRLAYWFIEHFRGNAALGIYSVGNQLAESAWLAPRSLGLVLVSKVSNIAHDGEQRWLTLIIARLAIAMALSVVLVLWLLPDAVFSWAFGKEIIGLRPILLLLSPGIIAMAVSQAFSHYFSGTGRNVHNLIGSGLGMLVSVVCGLYLVPRFGLKGAAATASLAYGTSILYQLIVFMRGGRSRWSDLLPGREDLTRAKALLRSVRS